MMIRYEKYLEDGFIYYRMQRGVYSAIVAVAPIELEVGRDVVARKLLRTRQMLCRMVVIGAYR